MRQTERRKKVREGKEGIEKRQSRLELRIGREGRVSLVRERGVRGGGGGEEQCKTNSIGVRM